MAALPARAEALSSGRFTGVNGHDASGTVTIERQAGRAVLMLGPDFSFDGAPDPKVALGKGGYDPRAQLAPLKSDEGAQSYDIPASLDVTGYDEVWIWCEEFAVPLGMAKLK
nr:DM13 domain-containing protein [Jiella sonneratiae]